MEMNKDVSQGDRQATKQTANDLYREFWTLLIQRCRDEASSFWGTTPARTGWIAWATQRPGLTHVFSFNKGVAEVILELRHGKLPKTNTEAHIRTRRNIFQAISCKRELVDQAVDRAIEWDGWVFENSKPQIMILIPNVNVRDRETWDGLISEMVATLNALKSGVELALSGPPIVSVAPAPMEHHPEEVSG